MELINFNVNCILQKSGVKILKPANNWFARYSTLSDISEEASIRSA